MRKSLNPCPLEHDDILEINRIDIDKIINIGQELRSLIEDFILGQN
jgi:hypothetical protein